MKLLRFLTAILLISLYTSQTLAVNFQQEDKQRHFWATAGLSSMVYSISRSNDNSKFVSFLMGFGTAMAIGFAKEQTDPVFDHADLRADFIGASMGPMTMISFEF